MNLKTEPAVLCSNAAPLHCQHRSASGRRFCRLAVSDPATGLCFKHAAEQKKDRDAANVASQLIGDTQEFTSAVAINRSLGELYKLLARDEIAPRRAAVMAYTCNLLLHTLPAIERELHAQDDKRPTTIIMDIDSAVARRALAAQQAQLAKEAQRQDPERAMYSRLAELYGTCSCAVPAGSDSSRASDSKDGTG